MGVDLLDYLDLLGQQKFRAIILHAPPDKSPELSKYTNRLLSHKGGAALDLLAYFQEDPQLALDIDRYGPEQLNALLVEQSKAKDLLVIDRLDFLLDTWRKDERQAFYRMVKQQWNSFVENTRATLVFCLQSSSEIEDLNINDTRGRSRVLALAELNEIY
jgi:hypothetical protein